MGLIFWILGLLAIVGGAGWMALTLREALDAGGAGGPGALAAVLLAMPGLSVVFAGLLLIAVGTVLNRLGRIVRNTADTADAVEALLAAQEARD